MIKKTLLFIVSLFILTSCASTLNMWSVDSNIRKVKTGMSQSQVIKIMGKTYKVVGAKETPEGYTETFGYMDNRDGMYKLRFIKEELIEWEYTPGHRHENTTCTKE